MSDRLLEVRALPKFLRSLPAAVLLVGILTGFGVLFARSTGALVPGELAAYDWLLRARKYSLEPDRRIVLVTVTEQDIRNHGQYPITDAALAIVLDRLVRYGARVVGLDIYRDIEVPPGRKELDRILSVHQNIIGIKKLPDDLGPGTPAPRVLRGTERVGFVDMVVDADGTVRRGLLYMGESGQVLQALSVRVALRYLESEGIYPQPDPTDPAQVRLGPVTLAKFQAFSGGYIDADDGGYQILLDFHGAQASPRTVTLTEVLSDRVDRELVRDKIVFVGVTAGSIPDSVHTPFARYVPGVAVHGQIASQLVRAALEGHRPIATFSDGVESAWTLLWAAFGVGLGLWARGGWRLSLGLVSGLFLLTTAAFLAFLGKWWLPLLPPALTWVLSASVVTAVVLKRERKERRLLEELFGRYVSREVAETIWRQRDQLLDGGRLRSQRMTVTVLFVDIHGYTAAAEKLEPAVQMEWVNSYLNTMAQVVIEHGGVIDDYAGDAIKADFGVPVARASESEIRQEAVKAVACALTMEQKLRELNSRWQVAGLPTVSIRVGIATGPIVAGSIGTSERLKYSTVGDIVNIAARLESLDPDVVPCAESNTPCRILIDGASQLYLTDRFRMKPIGDVKVKGRERPLTVYQVLSGLQEGPLKPP